MPNILLLQAQKITFANNIESEFEQQLVLELSCNSAKVRINDPVAFDVKLINKGKERLTVKNNLEWGYWTGLILVVKDVTGEQIPSEVFLSYHPPPSLNSSSYISLFPNHYLGATLWEPALDFFKKPGKYFVFAVYLNYDSESDTEEYFGIKNLWGRERNPIESPAIFVEVTG